MGYVLNSATPLVTSEWVVWGPFDIFSTPHGGESGQALILHVFLHPQGGEGRGACRKPDSTSFLHPLGGGEGTAKTLHVFTTSAGRGWVSPKTACSSTAAVWGLKKNVATSIHNLFLDTPPPLVCS